MWLSLHAFIIKISRQKSVDNNLTEIPNNSRYTTGSTNRPQVLQETDASAVAADYSRIGPSYETIDSSSSRRQQPVAAAGRRNVAGLQFVRLSERYEFSEPHLAMASASGGGGDGGGVQGEVTAADYEVLGQSEEHEAYSRLQH